jgi:glutamate racemase
MSKQPIGVFDSGFGGLTILKELVAFLPGYDYLYLGDNARSPYGNKTFETVYNYTLQSVKWLFEQGCPLVILACNTASAKALRTIQQKDLPSIDSDKRVLGVIRPTSEIIGTYSQSGHVGILGTSGTVQSQSYLIEIAKFFSTVEVTQEACPEWVSIVENNLIHTPYADEMIKKHIDCIITNDSKIDTLLLACTHYPLLMDKIKEHTPSNVSIVSQGVIVAESLRDYLKRHPVLADRCSKNQSRQFFTTGDIIDFNNHASIFFGSEVVAKQAFLH